MEREKNAVNNTFYDTLHERWAGDPSHPIALLVAENRARNPWIINAIGKEFSQPCHVLDIGCGGGLLCNPLSEKGHHVTGIDLSSSSLAFARQCDKTQKVNYLLAHAHHLPFSEKQFDVTCAMDLLEHVDAPETVIAEAARVTKPGGLFFFHTFNRNLFSYLLIIKAVEFFVKNTPKNMHVYSHFIRPKELILSCKKSGFEIINIQGLVPNIQTLSFWKTAFTRRIDENFSFAFSKSLATGYIGIARKIG